VEQLVELANKALAFRQGQRELLGLHEHANCAHAVAAAAANKNKTSTATTKTLGDVTSLNITTLQAGVRVGDTYAYNCVPPLAKCSLDIRISPHVDPATIGTMLDNWCTECSRGGPNTVTWNYIGGHGNDMTKHALTSTDPADNPWYRIFTDAIAELGIAVQPQVFPAATDSRFLRALGIRALGFSPMRQTEIMLHENDEYIPEATYLEGIGVYVNLIYRLAQADIP
jgi:aminoacylase